MGCDKVELKVVSGKCADGSMKIGDTYLIEDKTPEGICIGAFSAVLPYLLTLRYGGNSPWEKEEGFGVISCPDPVAGIKMEIRRIPS